jgi:hypothetical protein
MSTQSISSISFNFNAKDSSKPDYKAANLSHASLISSGPQASRQAATHTRHEILRDLSAISPIGKNGEFDGLVNYYNKFANGIDGSDPIEMAALELQNLFTSREEGLEGKIFYNPNNNEYIIAFGYTNEKIDWKTNLEMGYSQYKVGQEKINQLMSVIEKNNPNAKVTFTGQSLGGGLSEIGAYETKKNHPKLDVSCVSFNGPGFKGGIEMLNDGHFDQSIADSIFSTHYRIKDDRISHCGRHIMKQENYFMMDYAGDPEKADNAKAIHSIDAFPTDFEQAQQHNMKFMVTDQFVKNIPVVGWIADAVINSTNRANEAAATENAKPEKNPSFIDGSVSGS